MEKSSRDIQPASVARSVRLRRPLVRLATVFLLVCCVLAVAPPARPAPEPGEPAVVEEREPPRLVQWLEGYRIAPWLIVVIIAMLPIFELRGAIPVAVLAFEMSWWEAYALSVAGNLIPIIPIILLIGPVSDFLMARSKLWRRFFEWIFARTRRRGQDIVEKYQALGLGLFVSIPLPVTGAWTGSLLAFLMRIKARWAFPAILGGVMLAGVLVTLASTGVLGVFQIFTRY